VERRLLVFFFASTLFFALYVMLNVLLGPPPQARKAAGTAAKTGPAATSPLDPTGKAGQAATADQAATGNDKEQPVDDPARSQTAAAKAADGKASEISATQPNADEADEPKRPQNPSLLTLGSMDPASGYHLLATFNTRGGAIERLELTERTPKGGLKYRRVDITSGYLGYLAPKSSPEGNGCIVRVVGPGTPAALAASEGGAPAGLKVDDRIVAAGGKAIASAADLDAILEKTRPGEELSVEVIRGGSGDSPLKFKTTLTEHPLDLIRLSSDGGQDEVLGNIDRLSYRVTLSQLNDRTLPTGSSSIDGLAWVADAIYDHDDPGDSSMGQASFSLPLSQRKLGAAATGPLKIIRSYGMKPGSYLIETDVRVENLGDKPQKLAYRLEGPNGITLEGWWYSTKISPNYLGGAAARDIVYKTTSAGHRLVSGYELKTRAQEQPKDADVPIFGEAEPEPNRALLYAGVDAQYFLVAVLPPEGTETLTAFRRAAGSVVADPVMIPKHKERAVNVSFFLDSVAAEVPPGEALRQPLRLFAGPKEPAILDSLGLGKTIEYGWFGWVSKFLSSILHGLNWLTGNYGVAIILLTCLVRFCLFPISRNAAVNAQRMQELAPEFKKIAEKYKDDLEGRMRAQRDFQKRVGFNPMAGCLPALLQLPIFIGLYRCLSTDIELRQAPFLPQRAWASNLAGPDMLYHWGDWLWDYLSGRGTGWLGPYFNILPVFVVILFLIQQKMFMPPPTDEQQALTQKIMTYMTLMMAVFFFRVPAGLCVYFITSSLWGIAERIIVKKTLPSKSVLAATGGDSGTVIDATATATKPAGGFAKSFADRIREQMNPEAPKALPPNKRKRPTGKR
jgi:YidC/Oxa1 family membrane protein insertase